MQKYLELLEESKNGSDLVFNNVDELYYNLNKIRLSRSGSYTDSPERLKNNKATINQKTNYDKCFQYALTVALNYQNIKNNLERISKIKHFIHQYNWKEISFPSHKKDWKKFELNNKSIALNILYIPYNTEKIRHAYNSRNNLNRENQMILLMITDRKKWHYFVVKRLSALFRRMTSKHEGDFYCRNCLHSENKIKKHKNVSENHDYCYVEILTEDIKY